MQIKNVLLLTAALAQAPKYGKCNVNDRKDLHGKSFPIKKVLTTGPIDVSGVITIIDGCNFGVEDFVFVNADASYWFGGNKGSDEGITLSTTPVSASSFKTSYKFTLRDDAGSEANFLGFNEFRLFARDTNLLIATAEMPAVSSTNPSATSSVKPSSATSTSAESSKETGPNESGAKSTTGLTLGAILVALTTGFGF